MKYQIDYRTIYDHAPDMHLSVEAGTGRVIECNQTLLDTLGYSKDEVLAKTPALKRRSLSFAAMSVR